MNLGVYFIKLLNPFSNNQHESDVLTLFGHGVTQFYNKILKLVLIWLFYKIF